MRRVMFGALLAAAWLVALSWQGHSSADDRSLDVSIAAGERLLILAPHPDDESIGAAGLAQRVLARGGSVRTVIVTAGDGFIEGVRQHSASEQPGPLAYLAYGRTRIREAKAAASILGDRRIRVDVLGFPDAGLVSLLSSGWSNTQPQRSATTQRSAVPYREALERDLPYSGSNLLSAIVHVMRATRPTLIAFPDPLDEHPDHATVGRFSLRAVRDYMRTRSDAWPKLLSFLVHFKAWPANAWNAQVAPTMDAPLELPVELPGRGQTRVCLTLSDDELAHKQRAMAAYRTQQAVISVFLAAFVRRTECFSLNARADAEVDVPERAPHESAPRL